MRNATIPPMADVPQTLTDTEWGDLDEDVEGELVDGVLVEEEMAGWEHERVVAWLVRVIGNWAEDHGAQIGGSEAKLGIRKNRGRMPDLAVYLRGERSPPRRGVIRVPPSIVVEVVTPTPRDQRRDRVEKVSDYAEFGVRWYWLVDPEARTLEILELGPDGRYIHALGATDGVVEAPSCPGLVLHLSALWKKLDEDGKGPAGDH